jgi:hypothetical protein
MKAHLETTATCDFERHNKDGFAVIFFGNSTVKSTRTARAKAAKTSIAFVIRIQCLLVLDAAPWRAEHSISAQKPQANMGCGHISSVVFLFQNQGVI